MTIKSPLRYPGGKSRAISLIAAQVPDFEEFREPFVGGGSVFLHLKQQFPQRRFWINDLHQPLFHFWKTAQENPESLLEKTWQWRRAYPNGRQLHRFLIDGLAQFSPLETAAAFFIVNRISFSGTTESGGFSGAAFEKRFTESSIERLAKLGTVLQEILITNLDYQAVVEKPGDQVFIFLDPPYYAATASALYGKNGNLHKAFDHERFAGVMKNCSHRWLITYDDSPYIRSLFDWANLKPWNLTYGMRNQTPDSDQRGKELFISNF
jgi:DNA adenine methylase